MTQLSLLKTTASAAIASATVGMAGLLATTPAQAASTAAVAKCPLWTRNRPLEVQGTARASEAAGGMASKSPWTPLFKFVGPGTRES